jgi:hypothetical protein
MKTKSPPPPSSPPSRPIDRYDEDGSASTGTAPVRDSGADPFHTGNHGAEAYLFRYETMARQQEAEDMATVAHLNPCICRLMELLGMEVNADDFNETFLCAEVSFEQLRLAFDILRQQQPLEPMTTDRQLMMILNMLTQKVDLKQPEQNASTPFVTWAEIVQCYKICVAGMVTLQHLQKYPTHRARARDRTLAMLSLFEPPSTQLFHEDALSVRSSSTAMAALEESIYLPRLMTKKRSARKKKVSSTRTALGAVSKSTGVCLVAALLWSIYGGPSPSPGIINHYLELTQQGRPDSAMLTGQKTVAHNLIAATSKASTEESPTNRTTEPTKSVSASSVKAPPTWKEPKSPKGVKKTVSSSLLPHAPISDAIGSLFAHIVERGRRRSKQSAK